ncbi:hypothetical protein IE077_002936, partial [Cardiosporidium cionae]
FHVSCGKFLGCRFNINRRFDTLGNRQAFCLHHSLLMSQKAPNSLKENQALTAILEAPIQTLKKFIIGLAVTHASASSLKSPPLPLYGGSPPSSIKAMVDVEPPCKEDASTTELMSGPPSPMSSEELIEFRSLYAYRSPVATALFVLPPSLASASLSKKREHSKALIVDAASVEGKRRQGAPAASLASANVEKRKRKGVEGRRRHGEQSKRLCASTWTRSIEEGGAMESAVPIPHSVLSHETGGADVFSRKNPHAILMEGTSQRASASQELAKVDRGGNSVLLKKKKEEGSILQRWPLRDEERLHQANENTFNTAESFLENHSTLSQKGITGQGMDFWSELSTLVTPAHVALPMSVTATIATTQKDENVFCPICKSVYSELPDGTPGDGLHWIGCDKCERWFHWICVGYNDSTPPPQDGDWFCWFCTRQLSSAGKKQGGLKLTEKA